MELLSPFYGAWWFVKTTGVCYMPAGNIVVRHDSLASRTNPRRPPSEYSSRPKLGHFPLSNPHRAEPNSGSVRQAGKSGRLHPQLFGSALVLRLGGGCFGTALVEVVARGAVDLG